MDCVQISNTLKKIRYFKDLIKEKVTVSSERVENILGMEMGYKKGKNFPDLQNFKPFKKNDRWSFENDAHFLFYFEFKRRVRNAPFSIDIQISQVLPQVLQALRKALRERGRQRERRTP